MSETGSDYEGKKCEDEFLELGELMEKKSPTTKRFLSPATKKQYLRFYRLLVLGSDLDGRVGLRGETVKSATEKEIIDISNDEKSLNSKQGIINIAIILRTPSRFVNQREGESEDDWAERKCTADLDTPSALLIKQREDNKNGIEKSVKAKNEKIRQVLPTYEDLLVFLDYLFAEELWSDYVINYLLIYYQTRNADLNFKITDRKGSVEETGNWMWVAQKKAILYRRNYKTACVKGVKENTIDDSNFLFAIKKMDSDAFVQKEEFIGYYIRKATLQGLGEGNYMKIVVNHFRGNRMKLDEISKNRGTDLNTILSNYDVDFV